MRTLTIILSLFLISCGQNNPPDVTINNIPPATNDTGSLSTQLVVCSGTNGVRNFGPTRVSSITRGFLFSRTYYDILMPSGQFYRVFGTCTATN